MWTDREYKKMYDRLYYVNNKDRTRELQERWVEQNKQRFLATQKRYRDKNREKCRERCREAAKFWRLTHPEEVREQARKRRARLLNAPGSHTLSQWMSRVEYYGWKCFYCHTPLIIQTLTQDHRVPLSKGGTDWASNLVPCCSPCNSQKRSKFPIRKL